VKVGRLPQAVAVDAKKNRVYVANSHSDTISVIDGNRNSVLKTIHAGKNPFAVAVDANNGQLYVVSYDEPALTVIDLD
ncbi:MAG TPA: YncE family protein, partial [Candidatus Angelobacter sp.]|nr:YncE family protein [Candidatus Angelobacter sp.]